MTAWTRRRPPALLTLFLVACAVEEPAPDLPYVEVGGHMIFEGDIILDPASDGRGETGIAYSLTQPSAELWSEGVIPFEVGPDAYPARVADAIAHWEAKTSIRFVPFDPAEHSSWVRFVKIDGDACFSSVGRQGGKQRIELSSVCTAGLIVHEIGHAVGLLHEHTRSDRDDHVVYHKVDVDPDYADQYDKRASSNGNIGPYDYRSVMHYASSYFSRNGKPVLTKKIDGVDTGERIYNSGQLSDKDITAIEELYASAPGATADAGAEDPPDALDAGPDTLDAGPDPAAQGGPTVGSCNATGSGRPGLWSLAALLLALASLRRRRDG